MQLKTLSVQGYKSIRTLEDFEFRSLNVLIGANGAGKSNLISLFRLLAAVAQSNLQEYVQKQGGPDALIFGGRKRTPQIGTTVAFGLNEYQIRLEPTVDNRLIFASEDVRFADLMDDVYIERLGSAHSETSLPKSVDQNSISGDVLDALQSWRVYHFHDTSETAAVKLPHASNDNLRLKSDASNLAAYLARLKQITKPTIYSPINSRFFKDGPYGDLDGHLAYQRIVDTIRLAAPFFGDFVIREPLPATVELEWTERGHPDTPHRAHVLSDGTLRFICLTTLLLQPSYLLPDTILIDEPELGLHPYAINLLAEMIKQVVATKQVVISTQSVELLNHFEPEDVIVVDRRDGTSTFQRLDREELIDWLEDYTMGDLWKRNILGGRPNVESAFV